jgi:DNA invertase Pin-like site-specific DNA recombinase
MEGGVVMVARKKVIERKPWVRLLPREKFLYARVSSKDQNEARQLAIAKQFGIPEKNVFKDKITGRVKEKEDYDYLKEVVQAGDEVYFKELDRVGRDKALIKEELEWFKARGVIVRVLDIPTTLIEFPEGQEWVMEMVNNILIEVLGSIAEQEWKKIKKRQREGIDAMPVDENGRKISSKTGRGFGRAEKEIDLVLREGESVSEACRRMGISRQTYYRKLKLVEA